MDPQTALLCLRTTPVSSTLPSPMKMLMGRKAKSNLLVSIRNNLPDRDGIQLPNLHIGQHVGVQDHCDGTWTVAKVIQKCEEPRSFVVETPNGSRLRRHIRDIPEPPKLRLQLDPPPVTRRVRFDDVPEIPGPVPQEPSGPSQSKWLLLAQQGGCYGMIPNSVCVWYLLPEQYSEGPLACLHWIRLDDMLLDPNIFIPVTWSPVVLITILPSHHITRYTCIWIKHIYVWHQNIPEVNIWCSQTLKMVLSDKGAGY